MNAARSAGSSISYPIVLRTVRFWSGTPTSRIEAIYDAGNFAWKSLSSE